MNIPDQDSSPTPPGIDLSAPAEIAAVVFVPPPPPRRQPTSLARRISSRTTDLLAIAIVLVGSLALGRQVLEWWRADAPPILDGGPLAGLETDMGGDGQPVELEFADSPFRLIRQTLSRSGPLEALGLVQEVCQKALLAAQPLELPPDQAERDMLHAIEGRQPEVEQSGEWQIHRLGGNMVMLVGIRFFPAPTQKSNRQHATREPRVVCWGLVFPGHVAGAWTAYTFIKSNSKPNRLARNAITDRTAELDLSQVPLPEGCRRTVSVRGSDWNSLSGFQGTGSAADWRTHFSEWLASQGWAPVENWSSTEEIPSWSASFIRNNEDATTSNRILIQFRFDASGQGSGLIHGLPGPTANSKP